MSVKYPLSTIYIVGCFQEWKDLNHRQHKLLLAKLHCDRVTSIDTDPSVDLDWDNDLDYFLKLEIYITTGVARSGALFSTDTDSPPEKHFTTIDHAIKIDTP